MKKSGTCDIENTVAALEKAIENRKIQIQQVRAQSSSSVTRIVPHLFSAIFNRASGSYGPLAQALQHGGEFAKNFIKKTQQNVEDRPWEALQKVAVYGFGIGLFLSRRHQKSPTGEKQ
jgi:hypothetical protein